jgi:hypothetical protein
LEAREDLARVQGYRDGQDHGRAEGRSSGFKDGFVSGVLLVLVLQQGWELVKAVCP